MFRRKRPAATCAAAAAAAPPARFADPIVTTIRTAGPAPQVVGDIGPFARPATSYVPDRSARRVAGARPGVSTGALPWKAFQP